VSNNQSTISVLSPTQQKQVSTRGPGHFIHSTHFSGKMHFLNFSQNTSVLELKQFVISLESNLELKGDLKAKERSSANNTFS
jgi:hypothetical protein